MKISVRRGAKAGRKAPGRGVRRIAIVLAMAACVLGAQTVAAPRPARFLTGPDPGDPLEIARRYLAANRATYGLEEGDMADPVVKSRYVARQNGLTHLVLVQRLHGIEVYNGVLKVGVASDGRIVSIAQRFVAGLARSINALSPVLSAEQAVLRAASSLALTSTGRLPVEKEGAGPSRETIFRSPALSLDPIPARLVWFPRRPGAVRLAWDVRLRPDDAHCWQVQVDAVTGVILGRHDLVQRDSYKVYALPAESPNHVASPLPLPPGDGRTVVDGSAADSTASPFGWHDLNGLSGADTMNTTGNNVFAQTDLDANDAFTPGTDVQPTSATRDFAFPIDHTMGPETYREAVVANLFYWNNVCHDLHYLYGFDEASGNFQLNNYGHLGIGGDAVQADAQDGSGTDNANFLALPDGVPGRMQMYVWLAPPSVIVNSPGSIAGTYPSTAGQFGAQLDATGVTADVALVDDGTANGSQGCGALVGFPPGKIALVERGNCEFGQKVQNAENAGAIAAIVANNAGDGLIFMGPGTTGASVTIPSMFVGQTTGTAIQGALQDSAVNASLRVAFKNRDSDLDSGVIVHEYTHGVSNRLTGGPQMATCLESDQQGGEGWSDWFALVYTGRPGRDGTEPRGIGTYMTYEDPPVSGFGIRPYPYSTNLSIDPQTYGDLATGTLVVPHGVGSVWATILWEMHWALVNGVPALSLPGAGYRQNLYDLTEPLAGNQIALRLVMDGMKLQPCNPTFVDARDAILAADEADFGGAHRCQIWWAFAKRGVGVTALDDAGGLNVTESFAMPQECSIGPCAVPPTFAGAGGVVSDANGACRLVVRWSPAIDNCATEAGITYDVYRSTSPGFIPSLSNRIVANRLGIDYFDSDVESGVRYFYIVRARDGLGNAESNTTRRSEVPIGTLTPGSSFLDDAGDTTPPRLLADTGPRAFAHRDTGGATGPKVYATTSSGNYADRSCLTLESDTIYLGENPTLTFRTQYDIEPGWDGGIVEVATAAGNFTDWTKLDSIAYPGVRVAATTTTGCTNPGLRTGETMFTGSTQGQYLSVSGSLADYASQAVRLRFVFGSDDSTNNPGWLVDDVAIDDVQEPGPCNVPCSSDPFFPGLASASAPPQASCAVDLAWGAASPACPGESVRYNVYRSTDPSFTPAPSNAVALRVAGSPYRDEIGLVSGTTYHYIVRAEDTSDASGGPGNGGNEEGNLVRMSATPRGPLSPAPDFADDLEPGSETGYQITTTRSAGTWAVTPDPTAHSATNAWVVLDDQPGVPATTYRDDTLTLPPLNLTAASVMTFWHNFDFTRIPMGDPETSYRSGAVVEISADGGATWVDLGADDAGNLRPYIPPPHRYNGVVSHSTNEPLPKPLDGRKAFVGSSDGDLMVGRVDAMQNVTVDLGQAIQDLFSVSVLPGARVRFRIGGTFQIIGGGIQGTSWGVDDIRVTNVLAAGSCETAPAPGAGSVPDGSEPEDVPLRVVRSGSSDITLTWGPSCVPTDVDYAVYEGTIGAFSSHTSRACTTSGARTKTPTPAAGGTYYLVTARNASREGSYGRASSGAERPQGGSACVPQAILPCP